MVVGGPNHRTDYHIDESEEFFFQIKGDMLLKVVDGGKFRDIVIPEGHVFLLPPKIPHSPQRFEGTVGMVIERRRRSKEKDGVRWYCRKCHHVCYEEFFLCSDLGTQLKEVLEKYYSNELSRTCKNCGAVDDRPVAGKTLRETLDQIPRRSAHVSGKTLRISFLKTV
jgi:3-hydroxyanthranilate 3,4-dioxygenase